MTTTSAALVPIQPAFTDAERLALAGFLAGYRGLTREASALDLRQFTTWCRTCSVALFAVRRADIESFARDLEGRGRARATVTRRLCTIAGFYKYAVEEELLDHSPAAHVRRPRVDYESRAVALDRNELGALLVAAGLGPPGEHALISLLALNGLRVSEATGADIEHLGLERGHRTPTITRKGGKVVTIPLAPRTARAIDLAIGERTDGRDPATGRSVLAGRATTCLPKYMERLAYLTTAWRLGCYYRTYPAYVEDEVKAALDQPGQFRRGPIVLGARGTATDDRPAFAVTDRNYLSARWPGDAYLFARRFSALLHATAEPGR